MLHVMAALLIATMAMPIQAMSDKGQDDVRAPIAQGAMLNPEEFEAVLHLERQYFSSNTDNAILHDDQIDRELKQAIAMSLLSNEAGPSNVPAIGKRYDKDEVEEIAFEEFDAMSWGETMENVFEHESRNSGKEEADASEVNGGEFDLGYFSDGQPVDIKKEIEQLLLSDMPKSKNDIEDDIQRIATYEDMLRSNDSLRPQLKLRWLRNAMAITDNSEEKRELQQQLRRLQADMRCSVLSNNK